ncbi:14990_t:CDS:2, partial [Funneliformis caledonium]
TLEKGNEKVDLDYNIWLSQMKFLYGKAAGLPYQSTTVRTEGNRQKLIYFMSRSI